MKRYLFVLFVALISVMASPAWSQLERTLPDHVNSFVNDYADIMYPDDVEATKRLLAKVKGQTGIEITVLTIESLADYGQSKASAESFATDIFNDWGIGDRAKNNGIMLFIAKEDRFIRIEVGSGYGSRLDGPMQRVISNTIAPRFKGEDYSRGVYRGVEAIVQEVTRPASWGHYLLYAVGFFLCIGVSISCFRNGKTGWGWAFLVAAGVILWFFLRAAASASTSSNSFGGGSSSGGGASGGW